MLHFGVAGKSDLRCSSTILTVFFLQHIVVTCVSEQTVISMSFFMYISLAGFTA